MKKFILAIALSQAFCLFAQEPTEKEIKSEVDKVTVFFSKAQVTRQKEVYITPGKTKLKFVSLSPFINSKSVQVKVDGDVTVLSVNHQKNYLNDIDKPKELSDLESKYKSVEGKIKLEEAHISVIDEEIIFLQENRKIGGKNQALSVLNLKEASDFYGTKLTSLKIKRIERQNSVISFREEMIKIGNQINSLSTKKKYPSGEILVTIDSKSSEKIQVEVSYLVDNAGWFPSYDIRAQSVEDPLEIVYKANVHQDTKVDWKGVDLAFSSHNPSLSGTAPELKPYYLNYNSVPPTYNKNIGEVSGVVFASNGDPLPGASIIVTGTTIGTVADMNGYYSIAVPANATSLYYSFIGYSDKEVPINSEVINVYLEEDLTTLSEAVVSAYDFSDAEADFSRSTQGKVVRVAAGRPSPSIKARGASSFALPTVQLENQTSVEFSINMPYSISSDNKNNVVDLTTYNVPTHFEYYSVPKIDKDAFLMGYVTNWEQYNLLEGEANIFFEETYIGKSILDSRFINDTLSISLGRDKSVSVNREKIKDLTSWKFIGNKKEDTRAWKISIKNNKSQAIKMVLLDQVPVPTIEELELDIKELSKGKRDKDTGEIKWMLQINPNESKEVELRYTLKYPKHQHIVFE